MYTQRSMSPPIYFEQKKEFDDKKIFKISKMALRQLPPRCHTPKVYSRKCEQSSRFSISKAFNFQKFMVNCCTMNVAANRSSALEHSKLSTRKSMDQEIPYNHQRPYTSRFPFKTQPSETTKRNGVAKTMRSPERLKAKHKPAKSENFPISPWFAVHSESWDLIEEHFA